MNKRNEVYVKVGRVSVLVSDTVKTGDTVYTQINCGSEEKRDLVRYTMGQMGIHTEEKFDNFIIWPDAMATSDTIHQIAYNAGLIDRIPY